MAQVPTGGNYVVDNSTGANVRADINEIYDAILTMNSGAAEPPYRQAYTFWADTGNNLFKMRNTANDGWVELFKLDGTFTLEDGSASTPALAFRDDLDTGIFSAGTNQINFATTGVSRLNISSDNTIFNDSGADVDFRIESDTNANCFMLDASQSGIGINVAPANGYGLDILGNSGFDDVFRLTAVGTNIGARINLTPTGTGIPRINGTANALQLQTVGNAALHIDSSQKVGIGTTNPTTIFNVAGSSSPQIKLNSNDASPAIFVGDSNRSSDGQHLAEFRGHWNGTNVARMVMQAGDDTTNKDNGQIVFFTAAAGNPLEAMRIDSSGRVGIGTSSPASTLDVNGDVAITKASDTAKLSLISTGGSGQQFDIRSINSNGRFAIGTPSNNHVLFESSNNNVILADNAGNVGIGTTSPDGSHKTTIQEDTSGHGVLVLDRTSNIDSTFRSFVSFERSGTVVGTIKTNNSATQYNTSSDYRLKENAIAISDGITRLKTLKPYRFNFKVNPSTTVDGFFAHEVTAVPEAISGDKDAVKEDGSIEPQGIDQSKLVPLLVAAVQELIGKVEALEAA